MRDVIVGRPNDCTVASLLYRRIRVIFERAKDAKIVGGNQKWITDPDVRCGECLNYDNGAADCSTRAYPRAAFHDGTFGVDIKDMRPVAAIPAPWNKAAHGK